MDTGILEVILTGAMATVRILLKIPEVVDNSYCHVKDNNQARHYEANLKTTNIVVDSRASSHHHRRSVVRVDGCAAP